MSKISGNVEVSQSTLAKLAATYQVKPPVFRKVHYLVMRKAAQLAGNNIHKMTVEPDGSVIVWNNVVW